MTFLLHTLYYTVLINILFFRFNVSTFSFFTALRMVGTLQDETDRLRKECETSKIEMRKIEASLEIKTAEQERWENERTNLENRQTDLRQEIRKLSVQLAAKTEECARQRVEVVRVEAEARVNSPPPALLHSNQMTEQESDRLSAVMLERDQLHHENDRLTRQLQLISSETNGVGEYSKATL